MNTGQVLIYQQAARQQPNLHSVFFLLADKGSALCDKLLLVVDAVDVWHPRLGR